MKKDIIELTKSFDPKLDFTQADKQLRRMGRNSPVPFFSKGEKKEGK